MLHVVIYRARLRTRPRLAADEGKMRLGLVQHQHAAQTPARHHWQAPHLAWLHHSPGQHPQPQYIHSLITYYTSPWKQNMNTSLL
ncbi:hypothetical protein E2C01_050149 [Portunus trituberculatus]|uniref:Uncharacterized protein n=1 Tax=Portunus trituberculatus TaxID=210409 RepID=A0A5B7GF41_PORTR|nr:hypothetical protein [Portunus trituberculatus]